MTGIIHFEAFIAAGLLLNLTPGNDTIFILSRSIAQGKKEGYMSVAGIASGSLVHTTLAAFGLSAIIARSLLLFNIIKFAGAAYLLYIGYKMLTDRSGLPVEGVMERSVNLKRIYRDAVLTNVLNPKVALFYIAFLPQFIDPAYRESIWPFLTLGLTFTFNGTLWCLCLVSFASVIASALRKNKKIAAYLNKICGAVLIGIGVKVAMEGQK